VNRAAAELLGLDSAQAQSRPIEEVVRNVDLQEYVRQMLAGVSPAETDISLPFEGGRSFRLHGAALTDARGRRSGAVIVLNDLTRISRLETVRQDFVANVSHEFKNPLASIKGALALVLDGLGGDISAKQREMLEIAKKNIDRLVRLVTDLLDVSRIEAGKMKLKREKIALGPLVDEVIAGNSREISAKRLTFKKYIPDDIVLLWADKDKFTQVVINLVSNAIKYTPDGGKVAIKLARAGKNIRFEISNSGPGISKENIAKLFDKFERITAEKQEGTGLGLSITKDIIELHKGKIWAESAPGRGAKFIFTLPAGS
jgi:two-component system, OmpR family, phosphate regulon sensor histidine kinase PhoR